MSAALSPEIKVKLSRWLPPTPDYPVRGLVSVEFTEIGLTLIDVRFSRKRDGTEKATFPRRCAYDGSRYPLAKLSTEAARNAFSEGVWRQLIAAYPQLGEPIPSPSTSQDASHG